MNIALWALQIALAWLCIAGGFFQIFKFEDLRKTVASMRALPRALWVLLGAFGCLAGLGLFLPAALGLFPILTAYSALGMVAHSLLLSAFYAYYGDRSPLVYTAVMALIAAFIAYGRFVLSPF